MENKGKVLQEYVQFRRLKNHHEGVLKDIENHIKWFIDSSKKPLKDFDEKILVDYLENIKNKYSTEMLNKIKSSFLKNFLKWHFQDWSLRFRHLDIICKTEQAKASYNSEQMISDDDFGKLMKAENDYFWKAYFMTLFYGACRPIEVCLLKWHDVEFDNDGAYITIYSSKNKREFIKYLPKDAAFFLKQLKEQSDSDFVFAKNGIPISRKLPYYKMKKLSQKVLGKEIDLLTLRHSIATIIYNKDYMKDDDIARQMGHSKSMKGKYVCNNRDKLKEIARKIYISPGELPPEKKADLEKEISELKKENQNLHKEFLQFAEKIKSETSALKLFIRTHRIKH